MAATRNGSRKGAVQDAPISDDLPVRDLAEELSAPAPMDPLSLGKGGDSLGPWSGYHELPIEQIAPSPWNERTRFDVDSLAELAASIRQKGVLQPILVRPVEPRQHIARGAYEKDGKTHVWSVWRRNGRGGDDADAVRRFRGDTAEAEAQGFARLLSTATYQIIAGERRWRASLLASKTTIAAIVQDMTDEAAAEATIVENLQRDQVGAMDRAKAIERLAGFGLTQAQIAERLGISQAQVSKLRNLATLPAEVINLIDGGKLQASHGARLLAYKGLEPVQIALANVAAEKGWPVSKLEDVTAWDVLPELKIAKVMVTIDSQSPGFPIETCMKCPFGAFREVSAYSRYCLKPEHYKDLKASGKEAQRLADEEAARVASAAYYAKTELPVVQSESLAETPEVEAPTAAPPADTPLLPLAKSLPHGHILLGDGGYAYYVRGRGETSEQRPPRCSEKCPCNVPAISNEGKVRHFCSNPERFNALVDAHNAANAAERVQRIQNELGPIADLVPNSPIVPIAIAWKAVTRIISGYNEVPQYHIAPLVAACATYGLPITASDFALKSPKMEFREAQYTANFNAMLAKIVAAGCTAEQVLRVAAACVIAEDIRTAERSPSDKESFVWSLKKHHDSLLQSMPASPEIVTPRLPVPAAGFFVCWTCEAQIPMSGWDTASVKIAMNGVVTAPHGAISNRPGVYYCAKCAPETELCRECGCSNETACKGGCFWVDESDSGQVLPPGRLCSQCRDNMAAAAPAEDGIDARS